MRWFLARRAPAWDDPDVEVVPLVLTPSDDIVGETEAFLRGAYADRVASRGESPPDWAILNALAHSTPDDMWRAGDDALNLRRGAGLDGWKRLFIALRADLAALGEVDPDGLHYLQLRVLVPLELVALSGAHAASPNPFLALMRARTGIEAACRRRS